MTTFQIGHHFIDEVLIQDCLSRCRLVGRGVIQCPGREEDVRIADAVRSRGSMTDAPCARAVHQRALTGGGNVNITAGQPPELIQCITVADLSVAGVRATLKQKIPACAQQQVSRIVPRCSRPSVTKLSDSIQPGSSDKGDILPGND